MIGAIVVTGIVSLSIILFSFYYYLDPLGQRTNVRPRADTGTQTSYQLPDQSPITPVGSEFSQLLYSPTTAVSPVISPSTGSSSEILPTLTANRPTLDAQLTSDRHALSLTFGNLVNVLRITYNATYTSTTGLKGATGTIDVASPSVPIKRDITLGTCSKNVCVYDQITTPIVVRVIFRQVDGPEVELTSTVQI